MVDDANRSTMLPSKETLAFAVTIWRTWKESDVQLSLTDYIKLLRQHIAKGRRENALSTVYRHLDRTAYWRSMYMQAEGALGHARNEIVDLKRQIDVLKGGETARPGTARPGTGRPGTGRPASPTKKRKKQDEDVILVPRSPKRNKRDGSPARNGAAGIERGTDAEFGEAGEVGKELLRSVYHINAVFRTTKKTDPLELAYHLVRAATSIPRVVEREISSIITEKVNPLDRLKTCLTITSRAISSIMTGFARLTHVPGGPSMQGKVIYSVVVMFRDLLQGFTLLAKEEVAKADVRERTSFANALDTARPVSSKNNKANRANASKPQYVEENPILSLYAKFLGRFIDGLDPKVEANKSIFEGCAYHLLSRVGETLYTINFGRPREENLEAEIMSAAQATTNEAIPSALSPIKQETPSDPRSQEYRQSLLSAPYLLHLTNRLLTLAPAHFGPMSTTTKNNRAHKGPLKGALALSAKECLQRTLINCTFGMEGQGEDDGFCDFLKEPGEPEGGTIVNVPKVREEGVGEWFREELWKVLGWEILGKEGEWR